MENIKREAEERVNKEIERLFLHRIERIKDINSKEVSGLFYEIQEMEHLLREQEIKKYPELAGSSFFCNKAFLQNSKKQADFVSRRPSDFSKKEQEMRNSFFIILMLFFGWFIISVIGGWILFYFLNPPGFLLKFYSNYKDYIKEYELFCLSMMVVILSLPVYFLLFYITIFKVATWSPLRIKILLNAVALLMVWYASGMDGLGHVKGGRKDIRILVVQLMDWGGGVLINIFFLSFLILMIIVSLKFKES